MAATLAQIIGVEQGVRASTEQWWKLVAGALANEQLLVGYAQTYQEEEGHLPQPPKGQKIQLNAEQLITEARSKLARYFDVTASKDWGNTGEGGARADVTLNDHVILHDAPATYLLFLEKRLDELAKDLKKIKPQSLAEDWHPSSEPGVWRTDQEKRPSTTKIVKHVVVIPPTTEHPGQFVSESQDVKSGTWTTVKMTSAPTAGWLQGVQDRIAALREAVQRAIYDANKIEVRDRKVAAPILDYIFDGVNGAQAS